ncbi:septal ring lytic transglycosylase RlpA family protein [Parendozoicomonas haliclonae]|uniref:Endolytic peptidoglycan transglycosylase RlpA n=2 Tax=Parendozoicomonas haliclonae TaxID=1960125 RepID=A0A1X7AHF9_9GAMM|nr:RlpA-like protein precursor [Parendozoicomonas haliclonae]
MSVIKQAAVAGCIVLLAGCAGKSQEEIQAERYHLEQDSHLQDIDVATIPDAIPRAPEGRVKHDPYTLNGVRYTPLKSATGYTSKGTASWYGKKFHGYQTANGEIYDMYAMTAAHKTLPLPSYARVTNLENGQSVVVRVNDRGPFHGDRVIDLSWAAAKKLGYQDKGVAKVHIEGIDTSPAGLQAFHQQGQKKPSHQGTDADGLLYLQVAALSNRDSANNLQKKLLSLLEQPVVVVPADDASLFRVRVGPLASDQQLAAVQKSLESNQLGRGQRVFD